MDFFSSLKRNRKGKQQQQLLAKQSLDSEQTPSLQISHPILLQNSSEFSESSEFVYQEDGDGELERPHPIQVQQVQITSSRSTPNIHRLFKSTPKQKPKHQHHHHHHHHLEEKKPSLISTNSFSNDLENDDILIIGTGTGRGSGTENKVPHQTENNSTTTTFPPRGSLSTLESTSLFDRNGASRSRSQSQSPPVTPTSLLRSQKTSFEFKPGNLTKFVSLVANGSSDPTPTSTSTTPRPRTLSRENSKHSTSNFLIVGSGSGTEAGAGTGTGTGTGLNRSTSTQLSGGGDYYLKNPKLKTKRHFSQRSSPSLYKRTGSGRGLDEIQDVIKEGEAFEQYDRHQLHPTPSMMTISSSVASSNTSISSDVSSYSTSTSVSTSKIISPQLFSLQRRNSSGSVNINLRNKEEDIHNNNPNTNFKGGQGQGQFMSLNRPKKSLEEIKKADAIIQGIKKFNRDASAGMTFLTKNNIVGSSAEDVAQFLKKGENLSKTAIGTYLGEFGEFNQEVLLKFVELHDFTDEHLVTSLRNFLWSFRLPGEAQKIDRMMEAFAQHYCALNPGIFSCTDTCYIISFATIMLNTTLHNPNVKDKPSVEQFISMNRDIDNGKSLDPQFLISLYNLIRNEEFQIPREEGNDLKLTFYNPDIKGWLWKQGARYKNWTKRWFILSNNCLYYFKNSSQDKSPRGIIPLENIDATEGSYNGKYFTFVLSKSLASPTNQHLSEKAKAIHTTASKESIKSCKTLSDGTLVLGTHSEYVLGAEVEEERAAWIASITQNRSFDDYYTLLQEKKNKMIALSSAKPTVKLREKKQRKKPGSATLNPIRKSQIGMPLTRPKTQVTIGGIEVEMDEEDDDPALSLEDYETSPENGHHSTSEDEDEEDDTSSLILRMTLDLQNRDDDEDDDEDEDASLLSNSADAVENEDVDGEVNLTFKFSPTIAIHEPFQDQDVTMGSTLLEEIPTTPLPFRNPTASVPEPESEPEPESDEELNSSPQPTLTDPSQEPPAVVCSVQIHVSDSDQNICEIGSLSQNGESPRLPKEEGQGQGQSQGQGPYSQSRCVISINGELPPSDDADGTDSEEMSPRTKMKAVPSPDVNFETTFIPVFSFIEEVSTGLGADEQTDLSTLVSISVDDTPRTGDSPNIFVFPSPLSSTAGAGSETGAKISHIPPMEISDIDLDVEDTDNVFLDEKQEDPQCDEETESEMGTKVKIEIDTPFEKEENENPDQERVPEEQSGRVAIHPGILEIEQRSSSSSSVTNTILESSC